MTPAEWEQTGRYFFFNGRRIFFQDEGKGPALLLIHGFPTASWDWHSVWPALCERFRVLAPDLLGFGFSDKPYPHTYAIAEQADLAERLLKELNIKEVVLLAHDYGDTVAQELIARQNENRLSFKLLRAGLLNGGLFPGTYRPRFIQKLLMSPVGPFLAPLLSRRSLRRTFQRIFGPNTQPGASAIDAWWSLLKHNQGKRVIPLLIRYMKERQEQAQRWTGALQDTDIPLRLINGGTDPISGKHMAVRYREIVPRPDVIVLERIGHYPQIEAPDEVLKHFLSFTAE